MPRRTGPALAWTTAAVSLAAITVLAFALNGESGRSTDRDHARSQLRLPSTTITVYSGRSEALVGDLMRRFERETGIRVRIKYGGTGPLAAMILEEGDRCGVDVFFAQDPGGLGLLAQNGRAAMLPQSILDRVDYHHRDPEGRWIGITGRLRTLSSSTQRVSEEELPRSILDLTDAKWRGRVGWAPSNASFQAFITAMRHQLGEETTEQWLREMSANGVRTYARNAPIVQAIADGEIDLGLTNHYYLHRFLAERGDDFPVRNHVPHGLNDADGGDIGGAMLVAGVAILKNAPNADAAQRLIEFLLGRDAQEYFAAETFEYPLAVDVSPHDSVPSLGAITPRSVDLNQLGDLERTIALLRRTGVLE